MGKGYVKRKNAMKKLYLNQAVTEIERLEAENRALKEDPNTVIGQFIQQFREVYAQNSRLSVLTATLLKKQGGHATLLKDEMEAFKGNRINIKWELPAGVENPDEATEYVFSYELVPEPTAQAQSVTPTEALAPCTDPDCTLPRDLIHTHSAVAVPEPNTLEDQGLVDTLEDCGPGEAVLAEAELVAEVSPDSGGEIAAAAE